MHPHVAGSAGTPALRTRRRRAALGHTCPDCRALWALRAVVDERGLVVMCRHCSYERPVALRPAALTD